MIIRIAIFHAGNGISIFKSKTRNILKFEYLRLLPLLLDRFLLHPPFCKKIRYVKYWMVACYEPFHLYIIWQVDNLQSTFQ